jgi:PleD family two-component response regulator
MLTNVTTQARNRLDEPASTPVSQKVVVVNGSTEMLQLLENVLDAGHYNVVFVEALEHAYSQIKRVQPNLVILCLQIEDLDGFHVLSMLKLDDSTRDIPVLTYTTEYETTETAEDSPEPGDAQVFSFKPASLMN